MMHKRYHIFLKFNGIQGNVISEDHKGWIRIKGLSFSITGKKSETYTQRLSKNKSNFSNLTITRNIDNSSPFIMDAVGNGSISDECLIEFIQDSGMQNVSLSYKLMNAKIVDYKAEPDESGNHFESFVITFERILLKHIPNEQEAKQRSPVVYDHIV